MPRASASRRENLEGLDVEIVPGDLTDPASLDARDAGRRDALPRAPRTTGSGRSDPQELYRANVGGTENILRAAAEAGVSRVVYTSSVARPGPDARRLAADEETPVEREQIIGHYKKSKFDAERVAAGLGGEGPAGRHRQSLDAGRRARHQADADRAS